jgi:hypothetical protein
MRLQSISPKASLEGRKLYVTAPAGICPELQLESVKGIWSVQVAMRLSDVEIDSFGIR